MLIYRQNLNIRRLFRPGRSGRYIGVSLDVHLSAKNPVISILLPFEKLTKHLVAFLLQSKQVDTGHAHEKGFASERGSSMWYVEL